MKGECFLDALPPTYYLGWVVQPMLGGGFEVYQPNDTSKCHSYYLEEVDDVTSYIHKCTQID